MKIFTTHLFSLLLMIGFVNAQNCDPSTPVFNIDLTGQPNGTWTSTSVPRAGYCCSASGSDVCIQFNLTLDSSAEAINFNIVSGAIPGGSLFYQINCGIPQSLGTPICLNGPGPYVITFCKPGNNVNTYSITSIGQPELQGTEWVSQACTGFMSVTNLVESSITWTSVPSNVLYDSFLSCTSGCDSVLVQATVGSSLPSYIDYRVCGTVAGICGSTGFCDTLRINFVNDLAVSIYPSDPVLCYGINDTVITANVSGGLAPYFYSWNNGATTQNIRVGPGTYIVTINDSRNCSVAIDTVIVTQMTSMITANAGSDINICAQSGSALLSGSITTASGAFWYGGTGTFYPDSTSLNSTYIPSSTEISSGVVNLSLMTTGNGGCSAAIDQMEIRIFQNPAASISGSASTCLNSSYVYSTLYNGSNTYNWTVTGGLITQNNINSITVLWNTVGTGNILLNVQNSNGCDSTVNFAVDVNPLPSVTISGSLQNCTPGSFSYQVSGSTGSQYLWTVTNGSISAPNTNLVIINYSGSGTSLISITETDINGCVAVDTLSVQLTQKPSPIISGPDSVCLNETQIYSVPQASGVVSSWSVNGGVITSSSTDEITVLWNSVGNGLITLQQSSFPGCDTTITFIVDVLPVSAPVIIGNSTLCSNRPVQFIVVGAQNSDQILWNFSGGSAMSSLTNDTLILFFLDSGSETITCTIINSNGCDSTINFLVTVLDGPAPSISGRAPVCVNDISIYTVTPKQGHSYVWTIVGGSVVGFVIDNSIEVQWSTAGQGSVSCRQTSPDGCDSIAYLIVPINPLPVPLISGPSQLCQNETATFTTGMNPGSVYQWMINGNPLVQFGTEIQDQWPVIGSYSIQVNETTMSGCMMSDVLTLDVNPKPPAFVNGSPKVCISDGVQNYFVNGSGSTIYNWSIDGGGSIISPIDSDTIKVAWTIPGIHTVTLVATDPVSGCDSTISFSIEADTLQKPVITSVSGCAPLMLNISENSNDPSYRFVWNFGDGTTSLLSNPSHQYSNPGLFTITVIAENQTGCKDTSVATIKVNPNPDAVFTIKDYKDYYMAEIESLQLINQSEGANSYSWMLGNGSTSNQFQPNLIYDLPGVYIIELYVSNIYGCRDTFDLPVEIRIPENVFVPNTFTPNGDEKNDYFSMSFLNIKEVSVSIFNRWGEEIYNSHDTQFQWDGTYKGRPVQQEVYVYIIDAIGYYGTEIRKVGKVSLIR